MQTITLVHSQDNLAFFFNKDSQVYSILLFFCILSHHILEYLSASLTVLFHPSKTVLEKVESLCFLYTFSRLHFSIIHRGLQPFCIFSI